MFKIKFTIDKDVVFVSWLQKLSSFNKSEYVENLTGKYGKLDKQQRLHLEKFGEILSKKGNDYRWLYYFYRYKKIEDPKERAIFKTIERELSPFFEKVWKNELKNLRNRKNLLEKYDLTKIIDFTKKLEIFFKKTNIKEVNALLLLSRSKGISGATHKDSNNSILLYCSNSNFRFKKDIQVTIAHEIVHLFIYSFDNKLKKTFREIFGNMELKKINKDFSIRDILHEAITTSVCGGYLASGYFSKTYLGAYNPKSSMNNERSRFIVTITEKIYPMTKDYLENSKPIDTEYMEFVLTEIKKEFLAQYVK